MTRTTQPEAAAGLPEDEDFIVEGTGQLSIAAMQSLTDANPQQEAGAELSGNAGDLALETAIDWMELAAAMLGRGEMPAPGSAYAANWCMAHGVVLEAARRSMSQPQQEGASLPGGEGLKPCPMCGSGIIRERLALGESWVRCDDCGMTTDMFGSHERAIAAWNRRPEPPSLPADGDGALPASPSVPTEGGTELLWAVIKRLKESVAAVQSQKATVEAGGPIMGEKNAIYAAVNGLPNVIRDLENAEFLLGADFERLGDALDAAQAGMEARESRNEPQTPAPTTLNSEREAIARIIDPRGWETRDRQYADIKRSTMHDRDRPLALANADYYTRDSRDRADQIMALRPAGDYEDRLQTALTHLKAMSHVAPRSFEVEAAFAFLAEEEARQLTGAKG